jgi:hypothetical protein
MKAKVKSRLLYGRHHVWADTGELCADCGRQIQSSMHIGRHRRIVPAVPEGMESVDWWWKSMRRSVMGMIGAHGNR